MAMPRDKSTLNKLKQDALAIWDERFHAEKELSRPEKFLHFWVLVVKSFNRNRCPIRAYALSFTTLLALIPMLAVAISITSALLKKQGEDRIYEYVDKMVSVMVPPMPSTNAQSGRAVITNEIPETAQTNLQPGESTATNTIETVVIPTNAPAAGQTNVAVTATALSSETNAPVKSELASKQKEVAERIHQFVQNTRSGTFGFIGAIGLVLVGIGMLRSIESTFNDIWGVARGRNWLSTIQIYCTLSFVGPLLLVGAAALTTGPHLESTRRFITGMPILGPLIFPTLTLLVLWLSFTLFYQFVPNTKVRFKAALVGGIVGGTVWHVNNLFGFLYVSRVVTNSKIYGGLGLVPVFMFGLYCSWLFVLFGAQVSYAFQNRRLYLQERLAENVNQRGREFVALRLMTCIGQRFQRGLRAPTIEQMSDELGIPGRLMEQVLQTLVAAHLVIEIAGAETAYTPGRPLDQINAHHVLQAMRARGQELITREEPVREEVFGEFARIQEAEKQAASSITMLTLVHRAEARLELAPPPKEQKSIEVSPALVPQKHLESTQNPKSEIQSPKVEVKVQEPAQEHRPEPAPVFAKTLEPKPAETVSPPKPPVVEPVSDEEREFPL